MSLSPHPGPTNWVSLQQVCCERSIRKFCGGFKGLHVCFYDLEDAEG